MKNKEILKYIEMCQSAWSDIASSDYIMQHGIDGETFNFTKTDVEGFWVEDVENIYIVFRSTENTVKEWLDNFKFLPTRGFHEGICKKVTLDIWKYIFNIPNKNDKHICFVGYSLGGGIARYLGQKISINK